MGARLEIPEKDLIYIIKEPKSNELVVTSYHEGRFYREYTYDQTQTIHEFWRDIFSTSIPITEKYLDYFSKRIKGEHWLPMASRLTPYSLKSMKFEFEILTYYLFIPLITISATAVLLVEIPPLGFVALGVILLFLIRVYLSYSRYSKKESIVSSHWFSLALLEMEGKTPKFNQQLKRLVLAFNGQIQEEPTDRITETLESTAKDSNTVITVTGDNNIVSGGSVTIRTKKGYLKRSMTERDVDDLTKSFSESLGIEDPEIGDDFDREAEMEVEELLRKSKVNPKFDNLR
jgi:hypothetical protein